jgi:hypothetical protein
MDPHTSGDHESRPGFEHQDASPRGIALAGVGLMLLILLSLGVVAALFYFFEQRQVSAFGTGPTPTVAVPPGPGIQVDPGKDMQETMATQTSWLNSYGWINEGTGVIHMPIDHAMEMIMEHGMPTIAPTPTPAPTSEPSPTPSGGG